MDTKISTGELNRKIGDLPHGQSEVFECDGEALLLRISGKFASAAGVGTHVELHHEVRRVWDPVPQRIGIWERGPFDGKTFNAPGDYEVRLPPGRFWLHAAGPYAPGSRWSVQVVIESLAPREKPKTLEQRVAALERKAG